MVYNKYYSSCWISQDLAGSRWHIGRNLTKQTWTRTLSIDAWAGLREQTKDAEAPRTQQQWKSITTPRPEETRAGKNITGATKEHYHPWDSRSWGGMQRIIIWPLFLFQASAHIQQPNTDDPVDVVCRSQPQNNSLRWGRKGKRKKKNWEQKLGITSTSNNYHSPPSQTSEIDKFHYLCDPLVNSIYCLSDFKASLNSENPWHMLFTMFFSYCNHLLRIFTSMLINEIGL